MKIGASHNVTGSGEIEPTSGARRKRASIRSQSRLCVRPCGPAGRGRDDSGTIQPRTHRAARVARGARVDRAQPWRDGGGTRWFGGGVCGSPAGYAHRRRPFLFGACRRTSISRTEGTPSVATCKPEGPAFNISGGTRRSSRRPDTVPGHSGHLRLR